MLKPLIYGVAIVGVIFIVRKYRRMIDWKQFTSGLMKPDNRETVA